MSLSHDIVLDSEAFHTASAEMKELKIRTENLRGKLDTMYQELASALNTPAGKQLDLTAEKVLLQPIDDMLLVIGHISDTLEEIIGTGYYRDVFIKFEELNDSIKF
ncbi:MAG: hypothetical protein HFH91_02745 [Lachnospiraceae bacterium]|nr:hypothetical protein [Lachnospiraceae bacterium]